VAETAASADRTGSTPLSRLDAALKALLLGRLTATLGTLDKQGEVSLSMVPYAIDSHTGDCVLLISGLAAHTQQLHVHARASLLVTEREDTAENVHALSRVSLEAEASWPAPGTDSAHQAAAIYLARHPGAEMLTQLPDFRWVRLRPLQARHVAGFGAARSLDRPQLLTLIGDIPD
jgi:putative heme iron utilization protein